MDIRITRTSRPQPKPEDPRKLGFGTVFTDHMFTMDYDPQRGWHDPQILPVEELRIHPGAAVFHYGAEVFEGLKAYRTDGGSVQLFRPADNMQRMRESAERIQLPDFDADFLLNAILKLVELDQDWVPRAPGASLYIRPFEFCTDIDLGLHSIAHAKMMVILSPVGSYLSGGLKPVDILIEDTDVRAVRGGTGYAKCGGNYAAANRAAAKAEQKGFQQVLWLDGVHRRYIEEVGGMNVMFKIGGRIITPALTGSVLPGITRRSCIRLLRDKGCEVEERLISVEEVMAALEKDEMEEAWGCGTAAVISPIGSFAYQDRQLAVNDRQIGPCAQDLYDTLTGIQWGRREDRYGWIVKVPER
ncbi:MAG: branched-chain amino acid aminotransferase [Oscillospiraceae bacterium]|nr:branched-chain amino acid aminotransferase [Oscillospiraceae bacterium]